MNQENNQGTSMPNDMNSSSLGFVPNNEPINNANIPAGNDSFSFPQPQNQEIDTLNPGVANIENINGFVDNATISNALNNVGFAQNSNTYPEAPAQVQPEVSMPVQEPVQAPATTPTFNNDVYAAPVSEPAPVQPSVQTEAQPNIDYNTQAVNSYQPQSDMNVGMQAGPTMPIPDTMPSIDYQAGVSTPVDYATPASNFDEIGVTPEIDPKQKQKGKGGKTLLFLLIILLIAGLGAGSYYLINVKGIFNKGSIVTKNLEVELGDFLSENINDYATFKNTSASNCVQDLSKVNVSQVGKYEYTIKCGSDTYKGTITVKDTKAPSVELYAKVLVKDTTDEVTADSFIKSCSDGTCTYAFADDFDLASLVSSDGIKIAKINVSDISNNTSTVFAPVVVTNANLRFGIVGKKVLNESPEEYTIVEKTVVLYSDSGSINYTIYEFDFLDDELFRNSVGTFQSSENATFNSYSGIPVLNETQNKLYLVSTNTNNLVQGEYSLDRQALVGVGYEIEPFTSDNLSALDF